MKITKAEAEIGRVVYFRLGVSVGRYLTCKSKCYGKVRDIPLFWKISQFVVYILSSKTACDAIFTPDKVLSYGINLYQIG